MENQPLEEKIITISEATVLDWGIKLKDQQGLVYNVPATTRAGKETAAIKGLTSLENNGIGKSVLIKFVTVDNKQGGQSRYARVISQNMGNIPNTPNNAPEGQNKPNTVSQEVDWDDIAFKKCKHGYLLECFKEELKSLDPKTTGRKQLEEMAEAYAEMSMRKLEEDKPQPTEVDTSNGDNDPTQNDININDIPF
jgi:hypothetical protein